MKKILIALTLSLAFTACTPNKKTSSTRANTVRSSTTSTTTSSVLTSTTCSQGQSTFGTMFDYSYTNSSVNAYNISVSGSFEDRVKGLLSVSILPEEVGSISSYDNDSTGVRFQGTVKLNSSGQVVSNQSKLILKVYDSKVIDGSVDSSGQAYSAITVSIIGGETGVSISGQISSSTGAGYVIFKDSYGSIRLDGQYVNGIWQGIVSFSNNSTVISGASASSGNLGKFYIASCAFIQ